MFVGAKFVVCNETKMATVVKKKSDFAIQIEVIT